MSVLDIVISFFGTILKLLIAPFKNYDMLWVIIPVYINWILTEIYQEKKGTSVGNAIANGVVALFVGIDWARTTFNFLAEKVIKKGIALHTKVSVAGLMIVYGLGIVIMGIRGKHAVALIGRIREVTYITLMLSPIFYGVVKPTWTVIISILFFFPLFYGIIELGLYLLPTPKIYAEEKRSGYKEAAPTYYTPLTLNETESQYPRSKIQK